MDGTEARIELQFKKMEMAIGAVANGDGYWSVDATSLGSEAVFIGCAPRFWDPGPSREN